MKGMKNMMRGTDGGYDYIVVCETDCLRIGIKPLIEVKGSTKDLTTGVSELLFLAGIRIRAEKRTEDTIVNVGKVVDKLIPKVTWAKRDEHRASTVIACDSVRSEGWVDETTFIEGLKAHSYVMQMWLALTKTLQEEHEPVAKFKDVEKFFIAEITKEVKSILNRARELKVRFEPKGSLDNVVPLKAKL